MIEMGYLNLSPGVINQAVTGPGINLKKENKMNGITSNTLYKTSKNIKLNLFVGWVLNYTCHYNK